MTLTTRGENLNARLDALGACAAAACAIHCLAFPLLIVILPLMGLEIFLNVTAERVFAVATILLASFNLCWGYRIHKKTRGLMILGSAAIMILTGLFVLPHQHDAGQSSASSTAAITAASGIAPTFITHDEPHGHMASNNPHKNPVGLLLLIVGGLGITCSHLLNRHLCRTCNHCRHHHDHDIPNV